MHNEQSLIELIAIGLSFAFVGGYVAVRLRLSPIIGYLLAGIIIGPFTPGLIEDTHLSSQLAEIGVILLMFGVGMHFSMEDLWEARALALPGAIIQIVVATGLGTGVALLWGRSFGSGLVFGLSLSVASTVVMLRALETSGILNTPVSKIAIGWLIVEDLVTVVALVLLPAFAHQLGGGTTAPAHEEAQSIWGSLGMALGKVAVFVAVMLVFGRRIFPWLLKQVERTRSHELFTLLAVALSVGVAFGSAKLFDVSFALGAFFAGVVLNESDLGHRAAAGLQPLQEAFGVLFFVAVGMLFDPRILIQHPVKVLVVLGIIVLGKSAAALVIVLAFGRGYRMALTVAVSLAQIGEFSFLLAALGVSLGVLPLEAQNLILAGALLSIGLNPFLFRAVLRGQPSDPVESRLQPGLKEPV